MPKITFLPGNQIIEYETAQLTYAGEGRRGSVLDLVLTYEASFARKNVIQLRHACGGICACITCHVVVKEGAEHLSPMEPDEEDRIYRIPNYSLHSRLACRAVPSGDVTVLIPDKDAGD